MTGAGNLSSNITPAIEASGVLPIGAKAGKHQNMMKLVCASFMILVLSFYFLARFHVDRKRPVFGVTSINLLAVSLTTRSPWPRLHIFILAA